MKILILTLIVMLFIIYKRYFPIFGVPCTQLRDLKLDRIEIIDVRDYNDSHKDPVNSSINIPISYLKRNVSEIPKRDLHLIVSGRLEKNIAIRYLRKKGFRIVGYTIKNHQKYILKESSLKIKKIC